MLKFRIVTAAILIPCVVWGIFYLPLDIFAGISAFIFLLAAWEWAGLCQLDKPLHRLGYLFFTLIFFWVISPAPAVYPLSAALLTWLILPLFLKRTDLWAICCESNQWYKLFIGPWMLGLAWYAINDILWNGYGSILLLTLFLWVWGADIGAYFVGRKWGKVKLAPTISPGKTREGVLGGLITTVILAFVMGFFLPFGVLYHIGLILLSMMVGLYSVLGDLVESMVKRQSNVKDSGSLLPGHGGILDRIDSLISAAPIFAIGMYLLNYLK